MRPSEKPNGVINGPRPSPLMINNGSHIIRKQRVPIIIYTQSPKVIHTKAQDFMALVQRLTGKTASSHKEIATTGNPTPLHQEVSETFGSSLSDISNNTSIKQQGMMQQGATDGDETSSALRRDGEDCVKSTGGANVQLQSPSILEFANMPLFTPNSSSDFFCSSSRPVYQFSDSPYGILGSLISPSGLGFIKDLPDY